MLNIGISFKFRYLLSQKEMSGTSQQLFLEVKEKLDYYRLPTIFPVEATDLLYKVVKMLDKYRLESKQNNSNIENIKNPQNIVEAATKRQMGKIVKENNYLHLQLMTAKEQIQTLKHGLDKIAIEKSSNVKQTERIISLKNSREIQLFDQLTTAKYRYNELLDMVHEDPNIEKMYIKRLYKHKKYEIDSSMKETTIADNRKRANVSGNSQQQLFNKIQLLTNKLRNRESEIMRLQNKLEYDGINLNKVIKDFSDQTNRSKVCALQQQLDYLEQENKKMKQQVSKSRNTGGLKQALRDQVKKNHDQIKKLDSDNKNLRKKVKQTKFDQTAKLKENRREVQKVQAKLQEQQKNNLQLQNHITDLQKKVEFLVKETDQMKQYIFQLKKDIQRRDILIEELKNADVGNKILEKYQLQNLRRKIEESDDLMRELIDSNKKISEQNRFLREQGSLKSDAIQNLENIVEQLKRRNIQNQQNLLIAQEIKQNQRDELQMMRQIVDLKQQIVHIQNKKTNIQTEFERSMNELEKVNKERMALKDQVDRLKCRIIDDRSIDESTVLLKRQLEEARIAVRKEESARARAESLLREIQSQKDVYKKELSELSNEMKSNERLLKGQINDKDIKIAQLEETINIMDVRIGEKQSRIRFLEQKMNQYQIKLKSASDELGVLQEERHTAVRQKHRSQKRYEQLLKEQQQNRGRQMQLIEMNNHEHNSQIMLLRKEINSMTDKNQKYAQAYDEMAELVSILRREKDELNIDKINFLRENDHLRFKIQNLESKLH